ncbi:sigma-70 family RNA polymerase sigma factor [Burkholderia sp. L27(2015)]|uniref:sigma-70 family RNA polymerase sigma factor n=1 Tax=Burkholderia sp. L27(2015) TaxID=1641858 RepID=UPI00131B3AF0|nr:sigma-70 family RNA polymerase sigma factor [Burkholderia sp. L27(2015)]
MTDPKQYEALRLQLVKFARIQLRQDASVEDVVQETLVALLEHPERFAGQSSLKTYAIGILKHKIVDVLRRGKREVALHGQDDAEGDSTSADMAEFDAMFDETGHFREAPRSWGDPNATYEQKQFFEILELCIERLPAKVAQIFMMREWLGLETEEICKELGVTSTNAWVMLYRARMRLRECLQLNWFGNATGVVA